VDTVSESLLKIELDAQLSSQATLLALARDVSTDALVTEGICDYLRRQALLQEGTDGWRHY
jgi:hypothetical protein